MKKRQSPRPRSRAARVNETQEFAVAAARIAADQRTEEVVVLDLRGLSGFADYFVIGTGTSDRQMHAVAESIEAHARSVGRTPFGAASRREATWVLADYVDVVIHLFDAEHREYYDLESLWGDAPRVDWEHGRGAREAHRKA